MCGFCIETAYFSGDLEKDDPLLRPLQLMESPKWWSFYPGLAHASEVETIIAFAREIDDTLQAFDNTAGSAPHAHRISHMFDASQWTEWTKKLDAFAPDASMKTLIIDPDFHPCDLADQQATAARLLREFANRYFVVEPDNHLFLEGEWPSWDLGETARFFWVYVAAAVTTTWTSGSAVLQQIPFLPLRHPPSFLGLELWVQRRALGQVVQNWGAGVLHPAIRTPVRAALLKSAHHQIDRKLRLLGNIRRDLKRIQPSGIP